VISGLGAKLVRVLITKVMENTYYAELIIEREGELISVDARPSDSIAIALRMDARILTTDELLEQTAISRDRPACHSGA
jgi:bifunctional DNase/RNase